MDRPKKSVGITVATTLALLLLVGAAIGLVVIYSGAYNIAATEEHTSFVRWMFDTTFQRSIRTRASSLSAPDGVSAEAGAGEYKAMCQHCHGGPGIEPEEWSRGMRPRPPLLTEAAAEWEMNEVFWLLKHGAKMTGMPAFGPRHEDSTLWNVATFVKELPAMTRDRYDALGDPSHASRRPASPQAHQEEHAQQQEREQP